MAAIAEIHYKDHKQCITNVEDAQDYFQSNNARYEDCRDFLYRSTVMKRDKDILESNQKPVLECNILEPFVSKFCSEWAEQTPDVKVRLKNNHLLSQVSYKQADLVECHIRDILNGSEYTVIAQELMEDLMSGGFGIAYLYTEYENYKSANQVIRFKRVEDPKLCFFDPLAKLKHKADAEFCGELIPKRKKELEEEFPDADLTNIEIEPFATTENFRWGWKDEHYEDMVYVCNYFYKKYTYETFYEISDPLNPDLTHGMFKPEFDKWMNEDWAKEVPRGIAKPIILKTERRKICKIMRKQFVGKVMLTKPEETEFESLPYIFFDGNSKLIRGNQLTRPYIYNVMDLQRIKNLTLSTLVGELETMRQSDVSIALEALPSENQEFMQTWLNPQRAQAAFVHKAFDKKGNPLPAPTNFPRGGLNGELMQFSDQLDMGVQRGLGSYDQQNGMQNAELSGIAIVKGSINSNYSAMPYINNYVICLNQLFKGIVQLLPKFYKTMTTLPITKPDGKHEYVVINNSQQPDSALDYESTDLEVIVSAGANMNIQRMEAMKAILALMKESEGFRAMMEPKGLPILVDNLDIRGKDQLKQMADDFVVQSEQKAAQQGQKPDPMQVELQLKIKEFELEKQKAADEKINKQQELALKDKEIEAKAIDLYRQSLIAAHDSEIKAEGIQAENTRTQAEVAIKFASEYAKQAREDSKHDLEIMNHSLDLHKHGLEIHKAVNQKKESKTE